MTQVTHLKYRLLVNNAAELVMTMVPNHNTWREPFWLSSGSVREYSSIPIYYNKNIYLYLFIFISIYLNIYFFILYLSI